MLPQRTIRWPDRRRAQERPFSLSRLSLFCSTDQSLIMSWCSIFVFLQLLRAFALLRRLWYSGATSLEAAHLANFSFSSAGARRVWPSQVVVQVLVLVVPGPAGPRQAPVLHCTGCSLQWNYSAHPSHWRPPLHSPHHRHY